MNGSKGFTARYYATTVDPLTWRDGQVFNITGGSIKLTEDGLRESADIQTKDFDPYAEHWVRIYLDARQDDEEPELVPLFTGLASLPNKTYNGRKQSSAVQCYSVLKPAEDVLLPLGWYANAGTNGARLIYELLSEVIPAPISIDGVSPAIDQTIVAESGETRLSIVDYILTIIDWRLRIDGRGEITICPAAAEPVAEFDADSYDVIGLDVTVENNWYDCPNVFRAISDDVMAIARDEDPNSRYSIQNRGREVWMEDTGVSLSTNETIGQYAQRRLKEEQLLGYNLSYDRRFHPLVRPSDFVSVRYPEQDISGVFEVISQTISIEYGAKVNEEVLGFM